MRAAVLNCRKTMKTTKTRTFMTMLVIVLAILLVIMIAWKFASNGDDELSRTQSTNSKPQTETTNDDKPNDTQSGNDQILYKTRNVARKNDAAVLSSMVETYRADNRGKFPTAFIDNALTGEEGDTPIQVEGLSQYDTITVASGTQPALSSDALILATGAECSEAGATIAGPARDFAIQYMQEKADGTFTPVCMTT